MISIKKKIGLIILCVIMILIMGIIKFPQDKIIKQSLLKPEEVIEKFFKYYNEKNLEGINAHTTEKYHSPKVNWQLDNLEYIKTINITEDNNIENKEVYVRQRKRGQIIDLEKEKEELENLRIFKVKFEVKYKKDGIGPRDSGIDEYYYFLTREDKGSPWLISSAGY